MINLYCFTGEWKTEYTRHFSKRGVAKVHVNDFLMFEPKNNTLLARTRLFKNDGSLTLSYSDLPTLRHLRFPLRFSYLSEECCRRVNWNSYILSYANINITSVYYLEGLNDNDTSNF